MLNENPRSRLMTVAVAKNANFSRHADHREAFEYTGRAKKVTPRKNFISLTL